MHEHKCQSRLYDIVTHLRALKYGEICLKRSLVELNEKRLDILSNALDVVLRHQEFVGDEKHATSHYDRHILFGQKNES